MLAIDEWGPSAWHTLHALVHTLPRTQSTKRAKETREFLLLFARHLPCPTCRTHFRAFLDARTTVTTFESRAHAVKALNDAHNEVNRRCGKREWTLREHCERYRRPAERARDNRRVEGTLLGVIAVLLCASAVVRAHRVARVGMRTTTPRVHRC